MAFNTISKRLCIGHNRPMSLRSLFKSTSLVASQTMISRLLGFLRDMILALVFGAGVEFDAFVVAFKIPNFMRRIVGEGAFSQAFVPVLAEYREKHTEEEVQTFVARVAGTLGLILFIMVLVAQLIAPLLVLIFAPGFYTDPVRLSLAAEMLHITFPYIFFIGLVAFSAGVLNTFSRFGVPAFTPVLLNVSMIVCAWYIAPHVEKPIIVLAWGVFLGGVLQLLFQFPALKKIRMLPRPRLGWKEAGVRKVFKLMLPALFGVSVAQISILLDNFFASFLPKGSISWLYYSDRLIYLPLGVIGVALATVILPYLARHHARESKKEFSDTIDTTLAGMLLLGLPSAIGLMLLAVPILATLIKHGEFKAFDVLMTARSLQAFAIGLPAFMLVKILVSGFYSRQDIKTPVRIAVISLILNILLNLSLIHWLAHAGLALATSLASIVNTLLLLYKLKKHEVYHPRLAWKALLMRMVAASLLMVGLLWYFQPPAEWWLASRATWELGKQLLFLMVLGSAGYVLTLWLTGFRLKQLKS